MALTSPATANYHYIPMGRRQSVCRCSLTRPGHCANQGFMSAALSMMGEEQRAVDP